MELTIVRVYSRDKARKVQVLGVVGGQVVNLSRDVCECLGLRYDERMRAVHVTGPWTDQQLIDLYREKRGS